jgi:hypothetical protein
MFTFALIGRHVREKSSAWRHAGFVPKIKDFNTSLEGLQMYHDCLSAILADLEELQDNPPIVELNLGGMKKRVKIILQAAFVMGDQKGQDTLCGRKKNNRALALAGSIGDACVLPCMVRILPPNVNPCPSTLLISYGIFRSRISRIPPQWQPSKQNYL